MSESKWSVDPTRAAELIADAENIRDNPDKGPIYWLDGMRGDTVFYIDYILRTGMASSVNIRRDGEIVEVDAIWKDKAE